MDRRVQKTKEAIQSAYMALLIEKKTAKVSIAEIARKANIDRKTFYLHYRSTESIIKEITEKKLNDFSMVLGKNGFFERPYETNIYFQCVNQLLEQDIDIFKRIVKHPDCNYFWEQIEEVMIQYLTDYLSGIVELSRDEIKIRTTFLASGINKVYYKWLKNEIPVSLEELGHIVSHITYFGIQNILPERISPPNPNNNM